MAHKLFTLHGGEAITAARFRPPASSAESSAVHAAVATDRGDVIHLRLATTSLALEEDSRKSVGGSVTCLSFLDSTGATVVGSADGGVFVVADTVNRIAVEGRGAVAGVAALQAVYSSLEGREAAVGWEEGAVEFCDASKQKAVLFVPNADSSCITGIQWKSVNEVAISSDAGRISLVDKRIGGIAAYFHDLQDASNPILSIAVHPTDPYTLSTGCRDGAIKIWDCRNTSTPEVQSYPPGTVHTGCVLDLSFVQTDAYKTIVSASDDGTVARLSWKNTKPQEDAFSYKTKRKFNPDHVSSVSGESRRLPFSSVESHSFLPLVIAGGEGGQLLAATL